MYNPGFPQKKNKQKEIMSNIFKSERQPRQYHNRDNGRDRGRDRETYRSNNRNEPRNDFRGFKEKKKVDVEFKAEVEDFPELVGVNENTTKISEDCKLNFKEASTKEINEDFTEGETIPYGWVTYMKKNGEIKFYSNLPEEEQEESFHDEATNVFDSMIENWNNYKDSYDELHGDGAYDRLYNMPNYESIIHEDDED